MSNRNPSRTGGVRRSGNRPRTLKRVLSFEHLEERSLLSAGGLAATPDAEWIDPTTGLLAVPGASVAGVSSAPASALTPAEIRKAYGIDSIVYGSVAGNGSGQTIAIVDPYDDPNIGNDLATFDQAFGIAAPPSFQKFNQTGQTTNLPGVDPAGKGDSSAIEESLDVEWAHAVAPEASIDLVETDSISPSDALICGVNTARNLAGVTAVSMSFGYQEGLNEVCYDNIFTTPPGHAGVSFFAASGDSGSPGQYPAYSPNVVAVGGTSLYHNSDYSWQNETAWSGSGGGQSLCEGEPAYQNSVQQTGLREMPDVAFDANPYTGVAVCDSYDYGSTGPWCPVPVGGTSLATPCWAAMTAIANQLRASQNLPSLDGPTQTLPYLYSLPSSDFHTINAPSTGAHPYDMVTGLGTPIANLLVPALAQIDPTTVSVSIASPMGPAGDDAACYGQSLTLTATVTDTPSGGPTPTGAVTFSEGGSTLGTATLSGGTAALTVSTLEPGLQAITATYTGDVNHGVTSSTISPNAIIATLAGTGPSGANGGFSGDGGQASAASLDLPLGAAVDNEGNIFIADYANNRVREIVDATGAIITVAGDGSPGYSGDGGQATAAGLNQPAAVAVDNAGHLFIADAGAGDERIREVTLATGTIATVAGCGGNGGFGGDLGPATDARLNDPTGVAVDAAGNLYIADSGNERIRAVYTDGVINTIAGCGGSGGFGGDTFPATGAQFNHPNGLAVDASGNIYVADTGNDCIREVFARTGIINTVAGTGTTLGYSGDNGLAVAATLDSPEGVAVDASGNLFIADTNNHRIREVTHGNGVITTVAGDGVAGYADGFVAASAAELWSPFGVAVDGVGNLFIADTLNNRLREVSGGTYLTVDPWFYVGSGAFFGPGSTGMVWFNETTGQISLWQQQGTTATQSVLATVDPAVWSIVGVGNFDQNHPSNASILLTSKIDGNTMALLVTSSGAFQGWSAPLGYANPSLWTFEGCGNFNSGRDPVSDLLWLNQPSGLLVTWIWSGAGYTSVTCGTESPALWKFGGIGNFDVNNPSFSSVVWVSTAAGSGDATAWLINNGTFSGQSVVLGYAAPTLWTCAGVVNFYYPSDTISDLVWVYPPAGFVTAWFYPANNAVALSLGYANAGLWEIAGMANVTWNGTATAEILFYAPTNDYVTTWVIEDGTIVAGGQFGLGYA